MKFEIDNTFTGISRDAYEQLFLDDAFNVAMKPIAGLKTREMLEKRQEGGRLYRKIKVIPDRELPAIMKKLAHGDLVNTEDSWFDPVKHTLEWKSSMSVMTDKIKIGGLIEFLEAPGGVRRRLTGEIKVSIFGVGGMIEKAVVDNIVETYAKITGFTQKWVNEKKVA